MVSDACLVQATSYASEHVFGHTVHLTACLRIQNNKDLAPAKLRATSDCVRPVLYTSHA